MAQLSNEFEINGNVNDVPGSASFDEDKTNNKAQNKKQSKEKNDNYHVRAGRIGGETTKSRHHDSDFYRQIGAKGGSATMSRHNEEYQERRKKGGNTTRERYGEQYYQEIAAKAARVKQEGTHLRNEAIKALLADGIKIPTIIKLTLDDFRNDPRFQKYLEGGPVAEYLRERPDTENNYLFVSQSGKPLSLANTYTVMARHKE